MKNWLVVANSARARVLESQSEGGYAHVADLVHPRSRQPGTALQSDRQGQMESGHGLGSAGFQPHEDPHRHEQDRFAQDLARLLNDGVAHQLCAGLVLVASNPFLGLLKSHLSQRAQQLVLRTVPSDYTTLSDPDLAARLSRH